MASDMRSAVAASTESGAEPGAESDTGPGILFAKFSAGLGGLCLVSSFIRVN